MTFQLIPIEDLPVDTHERMFSLLSTYFDGVERNVFNEDLNQKNWVLLIEDDKTNALRGFSTLQIYTTQFQGERLGIVYSGDTIMDLGAWSSSILARAWISSVKSLCLKLNAQKFYWLLISSGYRTYRFLPVFWREFYPHFSTPIPIQVKTLKDFLARRQFGDWYDNQTGIVHLPHPQTLQTQIAGIPTERLQDPHVQFFQECNPGHNLGDELVCLTEIRRENLTSAGLRMWDSNPEKAAAQLPFATNNS
jgi:hypothetical protein